MKRSPIVGHSGSEIEKVFIYSLGLGKVNKFISRGMNYEPLNVAGVIADRITGGGEFAKFGVVTKCWLHERPIARPGGEEKVKIVQPLG